LEFDELAVIAVQPVDQFPECILVLLSDSPGLTLDQLRMEAIDEHKVDGNVQLAQHLEHVVVW